jgi:hypothetical protein
VSIAVGVSPNPVSLDERLTFTLVITHISPSRAKSVAPADSLPASVALICYPCIARSKVCVFGQWISQSTCPPIGPLWGKTTSLLETEIAEKNGSKNGGCFWTSTKEVILAQKGSLSNLRWVGRQMSGF